MRSSFNISFSSRDFYSNDITTGYGDGAFEAWTENEETARQSVRDVGNGSYLAELNTGNSSGATLFFVQKNGLNVPGSPFEVRNRRGAGALGAGPNEQA